MKVELLHNDVIIEVIIYNEKEIIKKDIAFLEWKNFKKEKGFKYIAYQKGFSSYVL